MDRRMYKTGTPMSGEAFLTAIERLNQVAARQNAELKMAQDDVRERKAAFDQKVARMQALLTAHTDGADVFLLTTGDMTIVRPISDAERKAAAAADKLRNKGLVGPFATKKAAVAEKIAGLVPMKHEDTKDWWLHPQPTETGKSEKAMAKKKAAQEKAAATRKAKKKAAAKKTTTKGTPPK